MGADIMDPLTTLVAKDEIRELVQLYARAADRRDWDLSRTLYTKDAIDNHGEMFTGTIDEFIEFVESVAPSIGYTGHHVCNHLISVDSETEAHGEAYVIAYHVMLDGDEAAADTAVEDIMLVRWLDSYRYEDGRWRIARRDCVFDYRMQRPIARPEAIYPDKDPSYALLTSRLFDRGPRP